MFTRSSACAFCGQREQDLGPTLPALSPKRHPGPPCDTHGWSRLPRGSGISRFARLTLGERKATGQMLPGAGWCGQLCPAPAPRLRPAPPSQTRAYLFSHGTRLSHTTRHSLGALKAREWGVLNIGGSPCIQQPPLSPPGPYSPQHRWVPVAHGVLAHRGGPVGSTERGQTAKGS